MQHISKTNTSQTGASRFLQIFKKPPLLIILGVIVLIVLIAIFWTTSFNGKSSRTEAYKEASGGAGMDATINYNCPSPCEQKFNFNVYIFNEAGQQVGVFRPSEDGKVQLAIAEGNYVMMIGKRLGGLKTFPQEPLMLKNGKVLELGLQY